MDSRIIWKNFKHSQIPSSVGLNKEFYKKIKPGSKVLDFGCAWGRIPLELQKRGYNVV
jgi:2-polyprenyl-3-methyl-5-hydroxy-6-metoxy-1,4-benzoquinol methylase